MRLSCIECAPLGALQPPDSISALTCVDNVALAAATRFTSTAGKESSRSKSGSEFDVLLFTGQKWTVLGGGCNVFHVNGGAATESLKIVFRISRFVLHGTKVDSFGKSEISKTSPNRNQHIKVGISCLRPMDEQETV